MALKTVTGKLTDGSGNIVPYPKVRATLSAPAVIANTQEVAPAAVPGVGLADGTWSVVLQSNLDLTPNTTSWHVEVGSIWDCIAVVPSSAGPFPVESIMAAAPAVSPPAALDSQVVHLANPETITGVKKLTAGAVADHLTVVAGGASDTLPSGAATPSGVVAGKQYDLGGDNFNAWAYGTAATGIANAIAAAAAAGGGQVRAPGAWTPTAPIQMVAGVHLLGDYLGQGETGTSSITWGGAAPVGNSQNIIALPSAGGATTLANCAIKGFDLIGGWNQINSLSGSVRLILDDLCFTSPVHAGLAAVGGNEEWYSGRLDFNGGAYGMYLTGDSPSAAHFYLDKSEFGLVEFHGQSVNGAYINTWSSNQVIWRLLRLANIAKDGLVVAGGLRGWSILNLTTENAAGWSALATTPATTGTITSGTPTLVVASTTGMVIDATGATLGSRLTISGAGDWGADLYANISNIVGTTVTLTVNAGTSVTNADTTFYLYSPITTVPAYFGGGTPQATIYDGTLAVNYQGGSRYGIDASGFGSGLVLGNVNGGSRPVYDPSVNVIDTTGGANVRRPNTFALQHHVRSYQGGGPESRRTMLASPPGLDTVFMAVDSTSNEAGTVGTWQFRRADPNRTQMATIDATTGDLSVQGGFRNFAGSRILQGSGAPTKPGLGSPNPTAGDIYCRTDTPGTVNQRLYICTVGGGTPTWVGIV